MTNPIVLLYRLFDNILTRLHEYAVRSKDVYVKRPSDEVRTTDSRSRVVAERLRTSKEHIGN